MFASRRDYADGNSPLRAARNVQEWLLQPQRSGAEWLTPTASSGPCATFTTSASAASGYAPPAQTSPRGGRASEAARMDAMHSTDIRPLLQPMSRDVGDEEDAAGMHEDPAHSVVLSLSDTDGPPAALSATLNLGQNAFHQAPHVRPLSSVTAMCGRPNRPPSLLPVCSLLQLTFVPWSGMRDT